MSFPQLKIDTVYYLFILIITGLVVSTAVIPSASAAPVEGAEMATTQQHTPVDTRISVTDHANTTIEVIVYLNNEVNITTNEVTTQQLQRHAKQTQRSFRQFADSTPGVTIKNRFWITNAVLAEINTNTSSLIDIAEHDSVAHIDNNHQLRLPAAVSDGSTPPVRTSQRSGQDIKMTAPHATYGLTQVSAPSVWKRFDTKGENVSVAVLDTGVDTANHSDIEVQSRGWKDFVNDNSSPYDDNGHGTHVSGTVVGGQQPDGTAYGVAPNASLLHGKVFTADGTSTIALILHGIEWAVANDADVISMSLGGRTNVYTDEFITSIQHARNSGVVFAGVAGNSGFKTSSSPGNVYGVVSTGATAADRSVPAFSGGEQIDTASAWGTAAPPQWPAQYIVPTVTAPGVRVQSAATGGGYTYKTGTSMAAPHVAGTIALVQSATHDDLSAATITTTLRQTASTPSSQTTVPNTRYGYGIINASAATAAVATPATYNITQITAPAVVVSNESYSVEATITNVGDAVGSQNITYKLVSETGTVSYTNDSHVALAGGDSTVVQSVVPPRVTINRTGKYTHVVETAADTRTNETRLDPSPIPSGAVYTDSESTPAQFDTDRDGTINQTELGRAGQAYLAGSLNQTQFGQMGQAYLASRQRARTA
jgi:subtilisin family serine protease